MTTASLELKSGKQKRTKIHERWLKSSIREYAIKKDTFRILQNFTPFHNSAFYFELVDCEVISRGKVDLLKISLQNSHWGAHGESGSAFSVIPDEPHVQYEKIFVLEDQSSGQIRALSQQKEKLLSVLPDFFPERYIQQYTEKKGVISYKSLIDFARLYNSK